MFNKLKKGFKRVLITVSMFLLILTGLQMIGSSINTGNEQLNQLLSTAIEVKAVDLENGLVIRQRQLFSGKIYLQYGGWATVEIFEGEDGRIYKCIDPTTIMVDGYYTKEDFPDSATYNYINDVTYYTPELKDRLSLINYFGDQETPGDVRTFFTMQYMWETINPTQFSLKRYEGMPSGVNESAYNDFKAEIDEKIRVYNTRPSFHNATYNIKRGESIILEDTNHSMNTFKIENKDGFIFEKLNASQLKVTATDTADTSRIKISKNIDPSKQYNSVVYRKPGSQTLGLFGIVDPENTIINFNVIKSAHIEVLKEDEKGNVVPGVVFEQSTTPDFSSDVWEFTTNENGIAKDTWNRGDITVYVREKAVPAHLVKSNEVKKVELKTNETTRIKFVNEIVRGNVEVLKVAEHDNTKVLPGAIFELIKDGKVIDTQKTGQDGIARFTNVEYGDYEVVEVEAPKGYFLPKDNSKKVKIEVQKQVIQFTAINEAEPTIQTKAHGEGQKVRELVEPKAKQIITETAELENLVVGESYKALLELVDLLTKKVVQTREVEFIATATTMTISENFEVNGFEFNEGVTFSEDLLRKNQKGEWELKATHNKTYDDEDQTVRFKKYGKIQVKKVDSQDGSLITAKMKFGLFRDGQLIEEIFTTDGIAEFKTKLIIDPAIVYEVKELEAPERYLKSDEVLRVVLTEEDSEQVKTFEYNNTLISTIRKPKVPTGDTGVMVYIVGGLISLVGLVVLRKTAIKK